MRLSRRYLCCLSLLTLLVLALPLAVPAVGAQGAPDPGLSPLPVPVERVAPPIPPLPMDPTPQPLELIPPVWSGPVRVSLYRVDAQVVDQVATTRVEQVFKNEGDRPLEGTYIFPLPENAAISEFNMFVDGQKVEGQLMGRDEARAIYESIVRQNRDPALLEYLGHDLFQASVFPIPPGGQRTVQLSYSQVLLKENGLVHYRYPLGVDHLTSPGRIAGRQPVDQLAISVNIESSSPLKAIYSPRHNVVVARDGDYKAKVGYEEVAALPGDDFDLYYSVDQEEIGVSLLTYKPKGEEGFFLLLAAPGVDIQSDDVVARDIILVLDTSGSMQGQKIEQARNALLYVLDRLNPEDRFNVISFSTGVRQFDRGLQPNGRLPEARQFVKQLEAAGGTDINRALMEALALVEEGRPSVIIFLTDGLPTEGVVQPDRIIEGVRQQASANVQLFTFGVGDDVNTLLLDAVAQENRGASAYVRPHEAIDEVVSAFYVQVATPVLSNLNVDVGAVFAEDLYPYPLPDLFAGSQLVVVGRYRTAGTTTVTLSGLVNGEEQRFRYDDVSFTPEGGPPFIAQLWASRKIGHLLNQMRLRGANQELVDEVVRLSTRYGIATPYTSFFVPEPHATTTPGTSGQGGGAPLPTPIEVEKLVETQMEAAAPAMAAEPASGAGAVQDSQAREALRSADTLAAVGNDRALRYAQEKAFALQGGLWVDTQYSAGMPIVEVTFGSAAYFELLEQRPQWAPYFAVSPNLLVALEGTAYRVLESTVAEPDPVALVTPALEGLPATSTTPAIDESVAAGQPTPPETEPGVGPGQAPLCTAPGLGLGLLLVPGWWAYHRSTRRERR